MSENLQERPSFCDVPGGVKSDALKKQCKPDSMGQTPPNRPDIRSKALTDTDEKKKKLQKLGLTHEKKETFQQFSNRIKEANLNDYVKKYQMKMGNKTSTVDKDAWVDGIGGLSKREAKTLKRQLQGHTREGTTTVKKFRKGQPDIQLDPPRGGKKWGKGGVNEVDSSGIDMYDHKRKESEMRKKARAVPTTPETLAKLKKARAGEVVDEKIDMDKPGAGSTEKRLRAKKKLAAQGIKPATSKYSLPPDWVEDNIDEKESDHADAIAAFKKKGGKVEKQPPGPISKSLFRTTVGREKRRNPGKQSTRDTFYDEVEVKELGPVGAFIARKAIKHVAKKAVEKVTSKNEGIFGGTTPKKTRDKLFLARSRENTKSVNELSKELLQRAEQGAKKKAGQQRAVSDRAASRVGDPNHPPGQNLKSKRANYQAATKDYQAFKFGLAAKKKDAKEGVDESNKLQADMALDDAGIKSYWEDGKLWVDKKDVLKAEKALAKSFKKGGEPHIYYKGGFLGVWNKKRKLTG